MKNAETPVVKVVLYGAMSSLGSALMAEMLRRQHEVIAILDDLTALAPRPGLRTKNGDLFDAQRVKQSVAGCSAVICLLDAPGLPISSEHVEKTIVPGPVEQVLAVDALIDGLQAASIGRLFVVGHFEELDEPGWRMTFSAMPPKKSSKPCKAAICTGRWWMCRTGWPG